MFRNHPDERHIPLTKPQEVGRWEAGRSLVWELNGLPTVVHVSGRTKLAALAGFLVTFVGKCGYSAITGSPRKRYRDDFTCGLLRDAEVSKVWHGTPVSKDHHKAQYMTTQEYFSLGGRFATRGQAMSANATAGTLEEFNHSVWIPTSYLAGEKGWHSCMPALCYRNGTLKLQFAEEHAVVDSVGNAMEFFDADDVEQGPTVQVTAVILPVDEIVLAPAQEWHAFESAPSPNSDAVQLTGLSTSSLSGSKIQSDCAIDNMLLMTAVRAVSAANGGSDMGITVGSFTADTLERWSCPFLDQEQTADLKPMIAQTERAGTDGGRDHGEAFDERYGFPHAPGAAIDADGRIGLLYVAAIACPHDMELTKLPRVNGTQKYNRQVTTINGASDVTLIHQWKPWTAAAMEDLKRLLLQSGDAPAVLGGATDLHWEPLPKGRNQAITQADARYLPWRLAPVDKGNLAGR